MSDHIEEPKHQEYQMPQGQEEQEQNQAKNKTKYEQQIINACKKGDYESVQKLINKRPSLINAQQKNKWNPLVYASCKGFVNIVKFLLSKGAGQPYTLVQPSNRIVIMGLNKQVKPNPLQWACFKGNTEIVLLLLKHGLHWQDVDSYGNNSVSLTAAGNHIQIFKIFLQYGVLINVKNSRGHTVVELTTHKEILQLGKEYQKSDICYSSKIAFKQNQIKHWCRICKNFFKKQYFKIQWVLKDAKSQQKNQIDGRCNQCWQKLKLNTQDLQKAMDSYDYTTLTNMIQSKKLLDVQFQVKFFEKAIILQQKLRTQNQILRYINTLAKVDNYKIILKAVDTIQLMVKDAKDRNVALDQNILDIVAKQKQRLIAQRNLRYLLDNIDTATAKREQVKNLEDIYTIAVDKKVATEYLDVANELKTKMTKAILAQDIYKMFIDYPVRPDPYPPPMVIDFKTKKPLDPQTKKPTDPVNLLPKPKKGKKVPKFMVPEWATQIKSLNQKIKQLQELCKLKDELNLTGQFVKQCQDAIVLMKKESRYRKDMDELQRMVDQANKKPKK